MLFDDKEEAESEDEASETPAQRKKKSDEALKKRKMKEEQKTKNKKAKKDTGKFNLEPNYFKKFEFSRQQRCAFFTL
jgi:hypothetical protein